MALHASAAAAICPTAETARQGFVLMGVDGHSRVEVKPSNDDIVSFDFVIGDKVIATPTYYKGVYLMHLTTEQGTTTVTYDFDYTKEPDLAVGYQKTYKITTRAPDGTTSTGTVENRVAGQEEFEFADCKLDTLILDGVTTYSDRPTTRRHVNYAPALRMFVRSTILIEGAAPVLQVYDRIEPLTP